MILLPISLAAILVFIVGFIIRVVSVLRKKHKLSALLLPLIFICLFIGSKYLPIPTFLDGLHDSVEKSLNRDALIEFAKMARDLEIDWSREEKHKKKLAVLRNKFPAELSISRLDPRIELSDNAVSVFYGSAITKHWGYAVVEKDECPIQHAAKYSCKKVFDNVWVYQTSY